MNAPLRTAVRRRPADVRPAAAQRELPAGRARRRPAPRQPQPAADRRGVLPRARADPGRRPSRSPRSVATDDRLKYLRQLHRRQAVRPGDRLLLARLRRERDRAGGELRPRRHRRQPVRPPGDRPAHRDTAQGRQRRADHQPGGPEGGVRRAARAARPRCRRGRRPEHRARSSPWSAPRRTTRTTCPATTRRRSGRTTTGSARRGPGRCSTGRSGRPIRPARPSSWSPPRRRWRAAGTRRTARSTTPPQLDLPQTRPSCRTRTAARAPSGQATLTDALENSCNIAFGRLGLELGDDALRAQAEKFGFNQAFEVPMRSVASRFPEDPDRAADRAVGDRAVRRPGHPAADGDGGGRRSPTAAC